MKKYTAPVEKNSLRIVWYFVLGVAVLIFVSLTVKTILMVRASKFDGVHRFTIAVQQQKKILEVLSFDPAAPSLTVLHLKGGPVSADNLGDEIGVLPDVYVIVPNDLLLDQHSSS